MKTPPQNVRCAVIDISPAYYELKKIVEDFGEDVSMPKLLTKLIRLWEYYHAVPDEYSNVLSETVDDVIQRSFMNVTKTLPESTGIGNQLAQHFLGTNNGASLKAVMQTVFHEVVQIIAHYLPTMFVTEYDNRRSVIYDVRFIVVGKQISGILLLEDNREPLPPTNTPLDVDYKNRQETVALDSIEPSEALQLARLMTKSRKKKKVS